MLTHLVAALLLVFGFGFFVFAVSIAVSAPHHHVVALVSTLTALACWSCALYVSTRLP